MPAGGWSRRRAATRRICQLRAAAAARRRSSSTRAAIASAAVCFRRGLPVSRIARAAKSAAMRDVSSQTLVRSLIENELKLPRYEQVVYNPDTIVYLRGQRLRFSQVQNPAALPFRLNWAEAQFVSQNDPSGLIPWAIGKILPGVNQFQGDALDK